MLQQTMPSRGFSRATAPHSTRARLSSGSRVIIGGLAASAATGGEFVTFRFTTAGESHGRGLVGVLEGIPAGLPVSADRIDAELQRRMGGYGRGARMKIEADRIEWLSGLRAGETLGSPIAMLVWNRDWENWQDVMAPEAQPAAEPRPPPGTRPHPGPPHLPGGPQDHPPDARGHPERPTAP